MIEYKSEFQCEGCIHKGICVLEDAYRDYRYRMNCLRNEVNTKQPGNIEHFHDRLSCDKFAGKQPTFRDKEVRDGIC